jgi:hypothetical protein
MKTPEELAEKYADTITTSCCGTSDIIVEAETAFLAGYQAAAPQWISVKDRLPEEDLPVLVYGQVLNDPAEIIGVRRRYNGDQEWKHTWESEDGFIYREDDVTHWMPLPKPPEKEL